MAQQYTYSSRGVPDAYEEGRDSMVIDVEHGLVRAGHGVQRLRKCTDAGFHCLQTSSFFFAVPKNPVKVGDSWEQNGQRFEVQREEVLRALGECANAYVIATRRSTNRTDYFYFSNNVGLLAIKFEDATTGKAYARFLLVESDRGFPH